MPRPQCQNFRAFFAEQQARLLDLENQVDDFAGKPTKERQEEIEKSLLKFDEEFSEQWQEFEKRYSESVRELIEAFVRNSFRAYYGSVSVENMRAVINRDLDFRTSYLDYWPRLIKEIRGDFSYRGSAPLEGLERVTKYLRIYGDDKDIGFGAPDLVSVGSRIQVRGQLKFFECPKLKKTMALDMAEVTNIIERVNCPELEEITAEGIRIPMALEVNLDSLNFVQFGVTIGRLKKINLPKLERTTSLHFDNAEIVNLSSLRELLGDFFAPKATKIEAPLLTTVGNSCWVLQLTNPEDFRKWFPVLRSVGMRTNNQGSMVSVGSAAVASFIESIPKNEFQYQGYVSYVSNK